MEKVSIIKYDLKGIPVNKKTLIHRALYGYIDHSNKGEYTYQRKGALKELKCTKIGNSVLMLEFRHLKQILPIFKKYGIKVMVINLFKKS